MQMKTGSVRWLWALALVAVVCGAPLARGANAVNDEGAVRAVDKEEAQALLKGDTAKLEKLWAPDLIVTASNNTIRTRTELLGHIQSGKMKLTRLDRNIERVAMHGQVAIAMGEETFVPAGGKGAGKTLRRRFTDVYMQQDGRWQLIARQASLIGTKP